MDKQQLVEKTTETLRPFETSNILDVIQHVTMQQLLAKPILLIIIAALFIFGIVKRSKLVLLTLFALFGMIVIIRFAMPPPGEEVALGSLVPFIGCGVVIGAVIVYFTLVKSE